MAAGAIFIWLVIALVLVGVPVAVICWAVSLRKRSRNACNEFKLFRMELSKLADEVGQLRQELEAAVEKKGGASG